MTTLIEHSTAGAEHWLAENTFYGRNRALLPDFFGALNMPDTSSSLKATVDKTQPWVVGDHCQDGKDYPFTIKDDALLWQLHEECDLVERRPLPIGHYDKLAVFGAYHLGNDKRTRFLRDSLDSGVTTDHVLLLGGERWMYPKSEPAHVVHNLEHLVARGYSDSWLERFMDKPINEVDETDLIRVAALDRLGLLAVQGGPSSSNEDWKHTDAVLPHYDFDLHGLRVTLTHSRARARKQGEPRHTTESCIADLVRSPELRPREGERIGIICSQPHLERMTKTVLRSLFAAGVQVEVVAGGPGLTGGSQHPIILGEYARNFWEDQKLVELLAA